MPRNASATDGGSPRLITIFLTSRRNRAFADFSAGVESPGLEKRLPLFERLARPEQNLCSPRPAVPGGDPQKPHPRLVRRAPALAQVADATRGHEIFPRVHASAGARQNVIDVQLAQRRAARAVLALMPVAEHQIATRESHDGPRGPLVAMQVDDPRHPK